ncbi:acetolactate decarboxylase [Granulicella sibirica]|uniref:Alpha-acetolactate decarboxylase n=1 Tax=Granulicella sibirica TaxID=2479048 RepID=A0A4Q0SXS9_9BACT|nr:acetolactate decarboxylase [Granulicella sibirica]RXH55963.1 Alpha-acetolactate decarboxylase [Granulicella sibirica]
MKGHRLFIAVFACALTIQASAQKEDERSSWKGDELPLLFQVSTLDALSQGVFEGSYSVGQLKRQGDFGVGTYDGLNGEMVVLDGHVYHAYADGTTKEAGDNELAPFAAVTFFKPQYSFTLTGKTMAEISTALTSQLPSANLSYAIKITGAFTTLQTRAIAKQTMPYPTLVVASAGEVVFNYNDVEGTAVVLRGPAFEKGINVVGDHFHFVSKDHTKAGHVLALTTGTVKVEVMVLPQTTLWLPLNKYFLNATLPYN